MPNLHNNALDDPIQTEACRSFAGGQRSSGPPDQLNANEAAELLNVDIRDGTACTRRGTATLGSALPGRIRGLCWYNTRAVDCLIACLPGSLHGWDGVNWSTLAATTGEESLPVSLAQLDDLLYLADGVSPLRRWDGVALTTFASGGAGDPPIGSLLISAGQRLWLAGASDRPDTLFSSKPLDAGADGWDATLGVLRIGAGEGDPITGLAEWDDYQIVVFKRNSIHVVRADPAKTSGEDADHGLSHAVVTKISDTIGCVAPRSIARVGSDVWFLSAHGVYNVGRVLAQTQRELKEAVSWPVQDLIERINAPAAHMSAAIYWNHHYLLSVPLDEQTEPGDVLVYHTQRQAWSGLWSGWQANAWAISQAHGRPQLNFSRADGTVRRWLDDVARENEVESTYQDAGVNITTRITSRALTLGEALCEKSGLSVQAEFFDSQATAQVAVRLNEDEPITLGTAFATSLGALTLPILLPASLPTQGVKRKAFGTQSLTPFRTLQMVITSPANKLSLRAVSASGFVDTVRLEE